MENMTAEEWQELCQSEARSKQKARLVFVNRPQDGVAEMTVLRAEDNVVLMSVITPSKNFDQWMIYKEMESNLVLIEFVRD